MEKYKEIGKSVINQFFIYNQIAYLDDKSEFFPILNTIIKGIIDPYNKKDKEEIKKYLEGYAQGLYCKLWISQTEENEEEYDRLYEEQEAKNTFNEYIKL